MRAYMKPSAVRDLERKWKLEREAIHILKLVVAEWKSDPMSVQCFDLRIVEKGTKIIEQLDKMKEPWEEQP